MDIVHIHHYNEECWNIMYLIFYFVQRSFSFLITMNETGLICDQFGSLSILMG